MGSPSLIVLLCRKCIFLLFPPRGKVTVPPDKADHTFDSDHIATLPPGPNPDAGEMHEQERCGREVSGRERSDKVAVPGDKVAVPAVLWTEGVAQSCPRKAWVVKKGALNVLGAQSGVRGFAMWAIASHRFRCRGRVLSV